MSWEGRNVYEVAPRMHKSTHPQLPPSKNCFHLLFYDFCFYEIVWAFFPSISFRIDIYWSVLCYADCPSEGRRWESAQKSSLIFLPGERWKICVHGGADSLCPLFTESGKKWSTRKHLEIKKQNFVKYLYEHFELTHKQFSWILTGRGVQSGEEEKERESFKLLPLKFYSFRYCLNFHSANWIASPTMCMNLFWKWGASEAFFHIFSRSGVVRLDTPRHANKHIKCNFRLKV